MEDTGEKPAQNKVEALSLFYVFRHRRTNQIKIIQWDRTSSTLEFKQPLSNHTTEKNVQFLLKTEKVSMANDSTTFISSDPSDCRTERPILVSNVLRGMKIKNTDLKLQKEFAKDFFSTETKPDFSHSTEQELFCSSLHKHDFFAISRI